MRNKAVSALAGPLAALLALGALGAYTSLSHLKGLSTREQALIFVVIAVLGALLGVAGASRAGRSQGAPSLAELTAKAEQFAATDVPTAVEVTLASPPGCGVELPTLTTGTSEQLVGLARSMDALASTAVQLAAKQAGLRANLAEAFVNLGRRNQNLVTRQLEYISELEQNEADPNALDELFRLDHLATRMRRNAESLLVLAGASPARQWDTPVAAMDIARAASAEVEDYKRLRLHHFDAALVSGSTTTDLVHILAELVENALTFSPPGSPVDIYGRILEGGYVIVIVDSGIGMPPEDLETANRRLRGEGAEGEVPGRYLGHFVAGSLAARHSVAISLQPSQSGGLVARVKIPANLVQEPAADMPAIPAAAPDFLGTSAYAPLPAQSQVPDPSFGPAVATPEPSFAVSEVAQAQQAVPVVEPATHDLPGLGWRPRLVEGTGLTGTEAPETGSPAEQPGFGAVAEPEADEPEVGWRPRLVEETSEGVPGGPGPEEPVAPLAFSEAGGQEAEPPLEQFGRTWDPMAKPEPAGAPSSPDLGMLAPLAGLAQRSTSNGPEVPSTENGSTKALHPSAYRDQTSPDRLVARSGEHQPAHAKRSPERAESDLHPAAQAKSTADALRRLTRRVPGAALSEEDGSLRRSSPENAAIDPTGITGALSQYFSVTAPPDLAPPALETTATSQNGTEHGPQ